VRRAVRAHAQSGAWRQRYCSKTCRLAADAAARRAARARAKKSPARAAADLAPLPDPPRPLYAGTEDSHASDPSALRPPRLP
jgi:hypothetical protein